MTYRLGLCVLRRTHRRDYVTLSHFVILSKHHHHQVVQLMPVPIHPPMYRLWHDTGRIPIGHIPVPYTVY
jgi:hypothetical protein